MFCKISRCNWYVNSLQASRDIKLPLEWSSSVLGILVTIMKYREFHTIVLLLTFNFLSVLFFTLFQTIHYFAIIVLSLYVCNCYFWFLCNYVKGKVTMHNFLSVFWHFWDLALLLSSATTHAIRIPIGPPCFVKSFGIIVVFFMWFKIWFRAT